jgi:hypothetical protein
VAEGRLHLGQECLSVVTHALHRLNACLQACRGQHFTAGVKLGDTYIRKDKARDLEIAETNRKYGCPHSTHRARHR